MDKYVEDLEKRLKEATGITDEVQYVYKYAHGYYKADTAGHGYLIVPKDDKHINIALDISSQSLLQGQKAVYLEEDGEMTQFLNCIHSLKGVNR